MESLKELIAEYKKLFSADLNSLDKKAFIEQQKKIELLGMKIRELQAKYPVAI